MIGLAQGSTFPALRAAVRAFALRGRIFLLRALRSRQRRGWTDANGHLWQPFAGDEICDLCGARPGTLEGRTACAEAALLAQLNARPADAD